METNVTGIARSVDTRKVFNHIPINPGIIPALTIVNTRDMIADIITATNILNTQLYTILLTFIKSSSFLCLRTLLSGCRGAQQSIYSFSAPIAWLVASYYVMCMQKFMGSVTSRFLQKFIVHCLYCRIFM